MFNEKQGPDIVFTPPPPSPPCFVYPVFMVLHAYQPFSWEWGVHGGRLHATLPYRRGGGEFSPLETFPWDLRATSLLLLGVKVAF